MSENTYSTNDQLETLVQGWVATVENDNPTELQKMIKATPTDIIGASENHEENRYQPGNQLVTYNGIDADGQPIQETWGGGIADIANDSVILINAGTIKYPEGHELEGQDVLGSYLDNGKFVVDQENGDTVLRNEYVSDVGFVQGAYGVTPSEERQIGFKLEPAYFGEIPEELGTVVVHPTVGSSMELNGGDFVVIQTTKGKISSVHGIESASADKTYVNFAEHMKSLE